MNDHYDFMPKFVEGKSPLQWHFDKSMPGPYQWKIQFGPEVMDWVDVRIFYIPEKGGFLADCLARLTYYRTIDTWNATIERQYHFNGSYGHEKFTKAFESSVRRARRYIEKTSSIIAYITGRLVVIPAIEHQLPHRRVTYITLTELGKKLLAEVQAEKTKVAS